MGFGLADLHLVRRLKINGYLPTPSAVVEIGAQMIDKSVLDGLEALGEAFGVDAACPLLTANASDLGPHLAGAPLAREIWEWLGLEYASIDIDGSPGSIPLDLNCDEVPADAKAKFRLVTNFGTTEHVANQLHAFKVIHDLTAVGGVMVHNVPSHSIDHGLFGYNPRFFGALSRCNGYRVLHMNLGAASASALSEDVVSYFSGFSPDFADHWQHYRASRCAIIVALQKEHDIDYVPPFDAITTTTDDEVLKRRYWTIFDNRSLERMVQSREHNIEVAQGKVAERERSAQARELAVFDREQQLAGRELAVLDREQQLTVRELALHEREQKGLLGGVRRAIHRRAPWLRSLT